MHKKYRKNLNHLFILLNTEISAQKKNHSIFQYLEIEFDLVYDDNRITGVLENRKQIVIKGQMLDNFMNKKKNKKLSRLNKKYDSIVP